MMDDLLAVAEAREFWTGVKGLPVNHALELMATRCLSGAASAAAPGRDHRRSARRRVQRTSKQHTRRRRHVRRPSAQAIPRSVRLHRLTCHRRAAVSPWHCTLRVVSPIGTTDGAAQNRPLALHECIAASVHRACVTGQERATVRSDRSLLTCMRPGHERDGSLLTHAYMDYDDQAAHHA